MAINLNIQSRDTALTMRKRGKAGTAVDMDFFYLVDDDGDYLVDGDGDRFYGATTSITPILLTMSKRDTAVIMRKRNG